MFTIALGFGLAGMLGLPLVVAKKISDSGVSIGKKYGYQIKFIYYAFILATLCTIASYGTGLLAPDPNHSASISIYEDLAAELYKSHSILKYSAMVWWVLFVSACSPIIYMIIKHKNGVNPLLDGGSDRAAH